MTETPDGAEDGVEEVAEEVVVEPEQVEPEAVGETLAGTEPGNRPEVATDGSQDGRPRWVELATSADHKDIGRLLIGTSVGALFLAIVELVILRIQLAVPENGLLESVTFDRLLSMYGATGIFFFALPLVFGLFYFLIPLMIGSRGTALPRLGQIGVWLVMLGGTLLYSTILFTPPEAGINPLPPFSEVAFTTNNGVDAWIVSTGMATLGILMLAIDLLVTLKHLRAPGMAWRRAPVFVWSGAIASWLFLFIAPIFLAALTMLLVDRRLDGSFFTGGAGGAPLLWQHLSYIFLAGTYMLVAIFAIGAITEIVQTFTRRPLRGRNAVVRSMIAIAILGTLAWTQNMYTAPIPSFWKYLSMFLAIALIVPFGVIFQSLISAVARNDFNMSAPLRYAMGALSFASVGLIVEVSQSMLAIGTQLQQTYDAWAATHFALFGFAVFGGLAALSYWYPKLTGTYLNEERAAKSFWLIYAGGLIALVPLFGAGVEGQVTDAFRFFGGEGLGFFNLVSSIGTLVLFLGLVLTIGNLIRSRVEEKAAPPDPWRGETLEWLTMSPPPPHNFDVLPDVRSANPMSDIREVLAKMDSGGTRETRESEPVA
jgi:heme/copper-type cytochrome/quinol oxidase subunit 1